MGLNGRLNWMRTLAHNPQLGGGGSIRLPLADGFAGTAQTINVIRKLVAQGLADHDVNAFALGLVQDGPNGRVVLELDAHQAEILDGTKVLKVPRSAREYQTEADAIRQLRSLVDGSIQFSVHKPEAF
jgi:hypothetical protein